MKNLSILLECFLEYSAIGPIIFNNIAAGIMAPAVENRKMLGAERPSSCPKGIANLMSKNGIMALKNTNISEFILCVRNRLY